MMLREAMASLDANPDIAAIVVTGADPAFGADPHGPAVTGGLELALA